MDSPDVIACSFGPCTAVGTYRIRLLGFPGAPGIESSEDILKRACSVHVSIVEGRQGYIVIEPLEQRDADVRA